MRSRADQENREIPTDSRKLVTCPHCHGLIKVYVNTTVNMEDGGTEDSADSFTENQRRELGAAKQDGTFQAWLNTFNTLKENGAIRADRADHAYLRFWVQATRVEFQQMVQAFIRDEYDVKGRDIYGLQHMHVVAAMVDGRLIAFFPSVAVLGRMRSSLKAHERVMPSVEAMAQWVRTKHGYVPAESRVFWNELRRRSIGEFSTVSLTN